MSAYGIRGLPLSLFRSYLSNRKQCVSVASSTSDFKLIVHGVPQGSVLGPLMFIIYVNDLFHFMSPIKCMAYADNTSLLVSDLNFNTLTQKSTETLNYANTWFISTI